MAYDRNTPYDDLSLNENRQRFRWLREAEARGELVRTDREIADDSRFWDEIEEHDRQESSRLQESKLKRELRDKEPEAWSQGCLAVWFLSGLLGTVAFALVNWLEVSVNSDRLIWIWIGVTLIISLVVARQSGNEVKEEYTSQLAAVSEAGGGSSYNASSVSNYSEYLRSSHWKVTKEKALDRADLRCQLCGNHTGQLDVHHNDYTSLGHERPEDLIVLCRSCHSRFREGGRMPVR